MKKPLDINLEIIYLFIIKILEKIEKNFDKETLRKISGKYLLAKKS